MLQPTMAAAAVSPAIPRKQIRPRRPFVYTFALGERPALPERIQPGEVVAILVADGTRRPSDARDWFAARVPVLPSQTGPLEVVGVLPGDLVEIEVLTLNETDRLAAGPLRVTVGIARSAEDQAAGPTQVVVPANSLVRLPARRPGGLLSIGPIVLQQPLDDAWVPIDAWVTIRCTTVHPAGAGEV